MKKTKYLALMLALGLLTSPITTYAQTADAGGNEIIETPTSNESSNGVDIITNTNPIENEVSPPADETPPVDQAQPEDKDPPVDETASESQMSLEDEMQPENDSTLDIIADSNLVIKEEYEEVLLNYKPDDLIIELPSNFNLELKDEESYGFDGSIHVDCLSNERYRIDIKLNDTDIKYINIEDASQIVSGVAYLGESDSYSVTYDEVTNGFDIPIRIEADKTDYVGQFTTVISFSVDIYWEQMITDEDVIEEPIEEEVEEPIEEEVDEPIDETSQMSESTESEEESGVELPENSASSLTISESNISSDYFVEYPCLKEITITKDVQYIDPSAFNNLSSLTDIYFEGSESLWNEIFTGSLNGVVIHFGEEDIIEEETIEILEDDTEESAEDSEITPEEVVNETFIEETQNTEEVLNDNEESSTEEVIEDISSESEEIIEGISSEPEAIQEEVFSDPVVEETINE